MSVCGGRGGGEVFRPKYTIIGSYNRLHFATLNVGGGRAGAHSPPTPLLDVLWSSTNGHNKEDVLFSKI